MQSNKPTTCTYHPQNISTSELQDEQYQQVVQLVEEDVAEDEGRSLGVAVVLVAIVTIIATASQGTHTEQTLRAI
jgi:hypothetical protein